MCVNPNCSEGFETVSILLDSPQEIYILAKHLPNSKPHTQRNGFLAVSVIRRVMSER
jgi:hypothetical protein